MFKIYCKDTLNWMNDLKLETEKKTEIIEYFNKLGILLISDDFKSDIIEVIMLDGKRITIMQD